LAGQPAPPSSFIDPHTLLTAYLKEKPQMWVGSLLDLAPPAIVTDSLNKITTITVNTQGQPLTIKDPWGTILYGVGARRN